MDEGVTVMSSPVSTRPAPIRVPVWAWIAAAVAVVTVYLLLQENGIVFTHGVADYVHEFTHDGRHALGVPCH
jgi:Probable cobalt transporter subunit (CbtB)